MSEIVKNLSVIAAVADNGVIGDANRLPWHLPADLQHFKRLSMGKPIVMGRKTWESLPGLLPGRTHVVVTRNTGFEANGAQVVHSLQQALEQFAAAEELMVVGGAQLYAEALPLAAQLLLTEVHASPEGDTWFPSFDRAQWREIERQVGVCDEKNRIAHSFVRLERVQG